MTKLKPINRLERVVLLCDFFSSLGGTEYYNFQLAQQLKKRGIDVRIYIGERPRHTYWLKELSKAGFFVRHPRQFHKDLESNDIETSFMGTIVDEINEWMPDIIHVHPFKKMAIEWFAHAKHKTDIPLVATEWTTASEDSKHWFAPNYSQYIQNVATYIATCQATRHSIKNVLLYRGPVVTIPHLVHVPVNPIPCRPERFKDVAFIGRFSLEKGAEDLVRAWPHVLADHPDATLSLYGHGEGEDTVQRLTQDLGVESSVRFMGIFEPFTGIDAICQRHQVFIQPSLFESIPTSLIELMLRGKTLVATDVGGIGELVSSQTGYLIESSSPEALRSAISRSLSNRDEALNKGQAARARLAGMYDLSKAVDHIIKTYEQTIAL